MAEKDYHETISSGVELLKAGIKLSEINGDTKKNAQFQKTMDTLFKKAADTVNSHIGVLEIYDGNKDGKLTEADISNELEILPNAKEEARKVFAMLEKQHPDDKPGDGSIDINQVAKREMDFLDKTFPDTMKTMKESIAKENPGKILTPVQTLKIINTKAEQLAR